MECFRGSSVWLISSNCGNRITSNGYTNFKGSNNIPTLITKKDFGVHIIKKISENNNISLSLSATSLVSFPFIFFLIETILRWPNDGRQLQQTKPINKENLRKWQPEQNVANSTRTKFLYERKLTFFCVWGEKKERQ